HPGRACLRADGGDRLPGRRAGEGLPDGPRRQGLGRHDRPGVGRGRQRLGPGGCVMAPYDATSHHTLSVLVENQPGVLARVAGLFSRRGFNIESLAVGPTEREDRSRITIRVDCSQTSIEQVIKQLYKLVNVLKVSEMRQDSTIERELLLVKVAANPDRRAELISLAGVMDARVVDVGADALVLELVAHPDKLHAFEELVRPYGIKEAVRTGRVAVTRIAPTEGRRRRLRVLA